ncbi:conserved hypothetical protein [Vibrio crassostreae]|nr:conserved hypothetical protein [Vibrio crassostreae]
MSAAELLRQKLETNNNLSLEEERKKFGSGAMLTDTKTKKKQTKKVIPENSKNKVHSKEFRGKNLNSVPQDLFDLYAELESIISESNEMLLKKDKDKCPSLSSVFIDGCYPELRSRIWEAKRKLKKLKSES